MARLFKCDRCAKVVDSWPDFIELPIRSFFDGRLGAHKELCPTCFEAFKRLVFKFMENK